MKISGITSTFNYGKTNLIKTNLPKLYNDVFVKSSSINFKGNGNSFDSKYQALKKDMTEYVMGSEQVDLKEVEKLVQKYSSETTVEDYSKLPNKTNAQQYSAGYTQQPIIFSQTPDGNIQVNMLPQKIFVRVPNTNDRNNKIIFLDRILHECTHVLQNESSDHVSYTEMYNKAFTKINSTDKKINSIKAANYVFGNVENIGLLTLASAMKDKMGSLPKQIPPYKYSVNQIFMKKNKMSANNFFINSINNLIKGFGNNVHPELILDFVKLKSQNEKEAYQNALNSNKELMNISGFTDFDLRIGIYDSIISACDSLLQKK